jgi:pyruvate/2-oxoglutarate dehydrogenase complex dihydrolipoamide dehydrogenase (E3) component
LAHPLFVYAMVEGKAMLDLKKQTFVQPRHVSRGPESECAVFTDPELGRIDMTEKEARVEATAEAYQGSNGPVAHAIEREETAGLMKTVVDEAGRQDFGCSDTLHGRR